ncbi:ribonuclease D [Marinomonas sp. 15G1-11]|uniref:Ribonuclease D n=1 Tax=Marinomonas phaeophyticola TaxID=3004091 RepID=A0ABT4JXI3_9GAMM|nr:ribonuclease D [Marinomonas sp. 15G1-11]MCZ2722279.1 ribonuclease D [Marinomonas sp. 15G1-11]
MEPSIENLDIVWVEDNSHLQEWCDYWADLPVIAVDTEFIRRTTYFPITGLIQVSEGEKAVLIDPLQISDWSAFSALMVNTNVMKVFHACSEDLDVFEQLIGVLPAPFFDTQIGEAYASGQWSLSYVKLVHAYTGIEVAKDETRSDWVKRPLTDAQKRYAALDVVYLAQVYPKQKQILEDKKILDWAIEDCEALKQQYRINTDPEQNWDGIKSAWRLSQRSLTFLRLIFIWRDQQARKEDIPKGQVLKDRTLWCLAKIMPESAHVISSAEEITHKQQRLYGDVILELVSVVNSLSTDELVEALPIPLPSSAGDLSKAVRAYVKQRASELKVAPEAVLKRKLLEPILSHLFNGSPLDYSSISMSGWRKDVIINPIIEKFGKS